jgi:hypothetical protein
MKKREIVSAAMANVHNLEIIGYWSMKGDLGQDEGKLKSIDHARTTIFK